MMADEKVDISLVWQRSMQSFRIEAPPTASQRVLEVTAAVNSHPPVYKGPQLLKNVEEPLKRLEAAPNEERLAFLLEVAALSGEPTPIMLRMALQAMASKLLRSGVSLTSEDSARLVEGVCRPRSVFPHKVLLTALRDVPMTPALMSALQRMRPMITSYHGGPEMKEIHERIDTIVQGPRQMPVPAVSGWSRMVFEEIDRSPQQMAWRGLFLHFRSLTQSNPTRKWQQEALARVDLIGRAEFLEAAERWLAIGPMPGMPIHLQMQEEEADYQKGFIWTVGSLGDSSLCPGIADFAFACFRKIPQIGAVSHRVGNACVNALAAMPGLEAVTQISRLGMRVKYDVAKRLIEKALAEAAERNHVGRDDLEAMAVPSFGLDQNGSRSELAGGSTATLSIQDGTAELNWSKDGKPVKSVPAEVKASHAELLAGLKKEEKELQAVLSTQRLRLERQLLSQSSCQFTQWKAWYLEHPVTAVFARRLIWEIEANGAVVTAIWYQDKLVHWSGNPVVAEPRAKVRLWHPIRAEVQEVLGWRCWLEDRGIRQPFKQAHREVYLLTEAERQTGTYSNRFAAHVVRQHQFSALCRERAWQFNLMGEWDSHNNPHLDLPRYDLRAEFGVDFSEGAEVSGHMVYRTISTGRIQFFSIEAKPRPFLFPRRSVPLVEIPPVVFSEVMRDVDLLVGVTSIGADPTWAGAGDFPEADYWHRFADGELSVASESRKSVLESLLPKLTIRERCSMDGRYLRVRGELKEYRIHLGSGNVIMEPGSRYLCIVQGPGDLAAGVPLPFEGDTMLALILSKAFLLANDAKIKDPTILQQIRSSM
jgi:Domain of unknown function (DUF4132)